MSELQYHISCYVSAVGFLILRQNGGGFDQNCNLFDGRKTRSFGPHAIAAVREGFNPLFCARINPPLLTSRLVYCYIVDATPLEKIYCLEYLTEKDM